MENILINKTLNFIKYEMVSYSSQENPEFYKSIVSYIMGCGLTVFDDGYKNFIEDCVTKRNDQDTQTAYRYDQLSTLMFRFVQHIDGEINEFVAEVLSIYRKSFSNSVFQILTLDEDEMDAMKSFFLLIKLYSNDIAYYVENALDESRRS